VIATALVASPPEHGTAPRPPSDEAVLHSLVRVNEHLASAPILWLSSTRPDGRPHIVPTWFDWDGEVITVFTKRDAQKVRNLRHLPSVMVALGRAEANFAVELLEGEAVVVDGPAEPTVAASHRPSPRFHDKYREAFAEAGFTVESFAAEYPQVVRIRLTRLLDWGARGRDAHALAPTAV
jgi:PPOX class probable F420-dependent enzyme